MPKSAPAVCKCQTGVYVLSSPQEVLGYSDGHSWDAPRALLGCTWGTPGIYFNIFYAPEALLEYLGILLGHFFAPGDLLGCSCAFCCTPGVLLDFFCTPGALLEHFANALAAPRSG